MVTQNAPTGLPREDRAGYAAGWRWAVALLLLLTAGCAERWAKPGGTEAGLAGDRAACLARGYTTYAPALRQEQVGGGYVTPIETVCRRHGPFVRCFEVGGDFVPPRFAVVDGNDDPRNATVRACLFEHGWTPS